MTDDDLMLYAEMHSSAENPLLKRIRRETHLRTVHPRMLSGHIQGRLLAMISHMIQPVRILEIGTFTGYSALCLAEGLSPEGQLITIECNPEFAAMAAEYFLQSEFSSRIQLMEGDAENIIRDLESTFDLVFIDGDKDRYPIFLNAVLPKVRTGGYILADNTLWGGKVIQHKENADRETAGIQEFNKMLVSDPRLSTILLPLRDGLSLIRKLSQ